MNINVASTAPMNVPLRLQQLAKLSANRLAMLQTHFGLKQHIFLPTVSVTDFSQALNEVQQLQEMGADGVFLQNRRLRPDELMALASAVAKETKAWIGVHVVRAFLETVFPKIPSTISGIWVEDAGINEWIPQGGLYAARLSEARQKSGFQGLYFGGVTLNHSTLAIPEERLDRLATMAMPFMDVVCVRHEMLDLNKIEKIRTGMCPDFPLAIAGNLNLQDLVKYKDLSQCFLVEGLVGEELHLFKNAIAMLGEYNGASASAQSVVVPSA